MSTVILEEGAELKDIKYIRSHAQAIDQCQKIIQKYKLKTIKKVKKITVEVLSIDRLLIIVGYKKIVGKTNKWKYIQTIK